MSIGFHSQWRQGTAAERAAFGTSGLALPFFWYETDTGDAYLWNGAWVLTTAVENVTKTVKAAGGDFTTVQAAIDWFAGRVILGSCYIDVDAGIYNEAVVVDAHLVVPGASLTLRGDTRTLAGMTWATGCISNQEGLAGGGTFNAANRCQLSMNAAGDRITVSGGTVDPDFDGWVHGDQVLIYGDDGTMYERAINEINPGGLGNNVIEITAALPAGAFPGGGGNMADATAICLNSNRRIENAGIALAVDAVTGFHPEGLTLKSTGNHSALVQNGAAVTGHNLLFYNTTTGSCFYVVTGYASANLDDGATSTWGGKYGYNASTIASIRCNYGVACGQSQYGFQVANMSVIRAAKPTAINIGSRGYYAATLSLLYATNGTARQCTNTGYHAWGQSLIYATGTNANNNGNGANYNPAVSCAAGNCNAVIYWS